ncbi:MAG: hypothetical protein E7099_01880 [Mediterranea massiliensis]|nr:hypothetical protein [Mediterranea massiliensis]
MEYFRQGFVVKLMAIFMIVVIPFDTLDYLNEQISIPTSSANGQVLQNADDEQAENDIAHFSSHRTGIKKIRIRISMWLNELFGLPTTESRHPHPLTGHANSSLWRPCPLRTLFCVFRL